MVLMYIEVVRLNMILINMVCFFGSKYRIYNIKSLTLTVYHCLNKIPFLHTGVIILKETFLEKVRCTQQPAK
jgi:hypothetical protein